MSDDTMPERLWAQRNQDDDTSVEYNAWHTHDDKFTETEYIRADVAQAQLDAANARIAELEALALTLVDELEGSEETVICEYSGDIDGDTEKMRADMEKYRQQIKPQS